ncbi:molybdenum cofactor biosynthesis protein A [Aquisphaera giovannonii]|uniref:Molybdenum cofactor biosynthesis protein A n=1 Tax=Aquisphaera giovannonii TaxID=406548 RepID=A0A5B9VVZ7_9BACT|nr:radical SAM protein [Aquisphaera giovannonii]QEH32408.1 molybdenum cofactor biosynthesis protein A [Aquisphaera giovannonii]
MPANGRRDSPAEGRGLIRAEACEVNLAHHCNLACRGCFHLSPILPKRYADPVELRTKLSWLARCYRAGSLRLIGGEPLLHPDIPAVIAAVRESGVSSRLVVVTNGLLLGRMPDAFWAGVDKVRISSYPGKAMPGALLRECRRKAIRFGVDLRLALCPEFREPFSIPGTEDAGLVGRIYRTCLHAHVWQCHTVDAGYFYKCPQSRFIPAALPDATFSPQEDGIPIEDSPEFAGAVRSYLGSPVPLKSCRHCLGSVGKKFDHELVERSTWARRQDRPVEDLVDLECLARLEARPSSDPGYGGAVYHLNRLRDYLRHLIAQRSLGAVAAALMPRLRRRHSPERTPPVAPSSG